MIYSIDALAPAFLQQPVVTMTAGGWVFMIAAYVFILTLTFYTFSKILKKS